jgi:hypothetical protein
MKITYTETAVSRNEILSEIHEHRKNSSFKVIDVGGQAAGWTKEVADLVIDINAKDSDKSLSLDICQEKSWTKLLEYVEANGIFDYSVCTHTLEDVYNPFLALEYLPRISKRGVIITPSIIAELSNFGNLNWKGNLHHRWIFHEKEGKIYIAPKMGFIENLVEYVEYDKNRAEIRYEWSSDISYSVHMNNFLGPTTNTVVRNYEDFFNSSLKNLRVKYELNNIRSTLERNIVKLSKKFKILRKILSDIK